MAVSETQTSIMDSKLKDGGLNPEKWSKHFKDECGVTDEKELEFLEISDLKNLQKHVEYPWEKKALTAFFQKCTKVVQKDQIQTIKERYHGLGNGGDQLQPKEKFEIKDEDWIKDKDKDKAGEKVTIDGAIKNIGVNSETAGKDISVKHREELTPQELLRTASGGLALKGLLLTNNLQHLEPRKTVVKVPKDVQLKSKKSQQIDDTVEFSSQTQSDHYNVYLDTLGRSAAVSANCGALVFQADVGFSISQDKTDEEESKTHEDVTYLSRVRYSYVPTAVCELDKRELKISDSLVEELRELERFILATDNQKSIQESCQKTLREYGSHIKTGDIEFGGMYQWQATYNSKTSSNKEKVKDMVETALSGCVSSSFHNPITAVGGAIGGKYVKTDGSVDASFEESSESNVTLKTSTMGGPLMTTSLQEWKSGLLNHNYTWEIIERGITSADFVGLWDLIRNNKNEFTDGRKLADTLQRAWRFMNGMAPEINPRIDSIDAVHIMDDLVNRVQTWNTDIEASFTKNATLYLQELIDGMRECCSITGDTKLWIKKLKSEQTIADFLMHIMDLKESYSALDLGRVRENLFEITEGITGQVFELKDEMSKWLSGRPCENDYSQSMMSDQKIEDIPGLIKAIREKLLCDPKEGDLRNMINVKATTELASAVQCLRHHFEKTKRHYDHFLLLVTLHGLGFDPEKKLFNDCLTEDQIVDSIEKLESTLGEFTTYKEAESTKFQAFLVQFLVLSLGETQHQDYNEQLVLFGRFIDIIRALLTSDIQMLLDEVTHLSLVQSSSLIDSLNSLKLGNKYKPRQQPFTLSDFDDVPSSEQLQNSRLEVPEDLVPDDTTNTGNILRQLGLTKYYPAKISLQDVMAVKSMRYAVDSHSDIPWAMLHKLITIDHRGRETVLRVDAPQGAHSEYSGSDDHLETGPTIKSIFGDILSGHEDQMAVNPLDVFIAVYACCDLILKQILLEKMFLCRLAVPFITPQLRDDKLMFSLWTFRSIIVEWKNKMQVCFEKSAVKQPVKTVSFLNLGKPPFSKSILLNNVISDNAHHTFWNRECPMGNTDLSVSNGLVEAQWFLPEGKPTDAFNDITMFLNLRGDACAHRRQVNLVSKMSNVIVCCLEPTDLDKPEVLETMKIIHTSSARVVLFFAIQDANLSKIKEVERKLQMYSDHIGQLNMSKTVTISSLKAMKVRTMEELKQDLRKAVSKLLSGQEGKSIIQVRRLAEAENIEIDEDEKHCKKAKASADEVMSFFKMKSANDCKADLLPLQGKLLNEWCKLQKEENRSMTLHPISDQVIDLKLGPLPERMKEIRQKQLKTCNKLSPFVKAFLENLLKVVDSPAAMLYMKWLTISLNELNRATLPRLQLDYNRKWRELAALKGHNDPHQIKESQSDLLAAEKKLTEASLGAEHLLREVAQIYEASQESERILEKKTAEKIEHLPEVVAKLLLQGQPMEIMDGDAANVPLTWVKAVFSSLEKLVGNKTIFSISVLGIQSSGKSTLLNAMFGLQCPVSVGRCTRGAYMQLVKVDKDRSVLPYDYVMIIDTEGLRAQDLGQLMHEHDNQYATFVIGLSDVTILNIKGEIVTEVSDVLQIAVHAFLRMELSNSKKRTCVFVHQNVAAVNAEKAMKYGCRKHQDTLDKMTAEACAAENIVHISTFNEVIQFDSETNVWYISDLWLGNLPMATVNPGYAEKVQEVTEFIVNSLAKAQKRFQTFSDMSNYIEDLWKAVLAENFVFSFRNSLVARLYNSLERRYHEKSWMVQNGITEWVIQTAFVQLEKCTTSEELERCHSQLLVDVEVMGNTLKESAVSDLQEFFGTQNQTALLIEWKTEKLLSLTHETQQFLLEAVTDIDNKKSSVSTDLSQVRRQEEPESELINKAKELARTGEAADEQKLKDVFDELSEEWSKKLAEKIPTSSLQSVEPCVQVILRKRLRNEVSLKVELKKTPLAKTPTFRNLEDSIQMKDIEDSHLSINISQMRIAAEKIASCVTRETSKKCREKAVNAVNSILKSVSDYLGDIEKHQAGFKKTYASNIINIVADGFQSHNQTSKDRYTMKRELLVKITVHACRYAVVRFRTMQKAYEESHRAKTDQCNAAYFSLFRNIVYQKANEVIAADLLIHQLVVFMEDAVATVMSGKVVNEIVRELGFQKYSLLIKILDDLTERGFADYLSYISNPKRFALKWVTTFTDETVFAVKHGKSRYVKLAEGHIHTLLESVTSSIKAAADAVKGEDPPTIKTWAKQFCTSLTALSVNENNMKLFMEQEVQDFTHFTELLVKQLPELEAKVTNLFKAQLAELITWEGDPPYEGILDKLWGCEAQCPLCDEICQKTSANHLSESDSHTCIQHRPSAVGGTSWDRNFIFFSRPGELALENCNFDVQSKFAHACGICKFECKKSGCSGSTDHSYQDYKSYLLDWDIAPSKNMESSKYWMWFVATYKRELAEHYKAKVPDIPQAWEQITKQQARASLRVVTN